METLPSEVINVIYSNCDFLTVVKSRRVCCQWNRAAQVYLAKVKVLYAGSNQDASEIAPWLEPDELEPFFSNCCNTIDDLQLVNFRMEGLIRFAAIYCVNIEAFICNHVLPFELFADLLGPKMKFFTGRFIYNWPVKGYDILLKFPLLEQFPAHLGPCNAIQLRYKLPLKSIQVTCFDGCGCTDELMSASLDLKKTGHISNSINPEEVNSLLPLPSVDPTFALTITIVTINSYHILEGQRFYFPNLKTVNISGYLYEFLNIRLSLADSPKLERLYMEPKYPGEILDDLIKLLPRIKNLKYLSFPSYDNFRPPLKFWQVLTSSCPLIEILDVPFEDLGPEEAVFVAKLHHLKRFECEFMTDEFIPEYLVNLNPVKLHKLTRGLCEGELKDFMSPESIKLLRETHRVTVNQINYFNCENNYPVIEATSSPTNFSETSKVPFFDEAPILTDSD